jgi:hypothetical protein
MGGRGMGGPRLGLSQAAAGMKRPSFPERAAMALARFIAGQERSGWLDAMEGELSLLSERRLDWALGSLVAAVKDRIARDWRYAMGLIALPCAAVAAIPVSFVLTVAIARATGLTQLQLMPLTALSPLPFAVLLGLMRPHASPVLKGLTAFVAFQAIPAIGLSLVFGNYVYVRWETNLSHYGLLPPSGLIATCALWCAGSWLGARWARRRLHRFPSSPSP